MGVDVGKTVLETFTIFPFSIVLALALGEAFKQFVAEHRPGVDQTAAVRGGSIQWDRLAALLTFLLLILPFYQGMNRYLLVNYGAVPATSPLYSAIGLILDSAAFMIESAVFFAMSRNLANSRWRYLYGIVLFLLVVDTFWGFSALLHPHEKTDPILQNWMILNAVFSLILILLIWQGRRLSDAVIAWIGTFAMLIRTFIDYYISWDFYFS